VQGIERVNIFGIRHFSPGASYHLQKLIGQAKIVLIEAPSDATGLIKHLLHPGVKTPVAILAYTTDMPVDMVLYPIADYSPEFLAMKLGREVRFIDLPSDILLGLKQQSEPDTEEHGNYAQYANSVFEEVARIGHFQDYDDYFEGFFEHNQNPDSFQQTMWHEAAELRQLLEPHELDAIPQEAAKHLVREAHMAMEIEKAITEGYAPEDILVVTGAYHAERLLHTQPMTQEELAALPRRVSQLTLMPYSYLRLSSRTGYGAGNKAPAYFQLMWECMQDERLHDLPTEYMSRLGRTLRESGNYAGTSNVIEAVRLARGLAHLRGGSQPSLADLHDGAIACLGHGNRAELATAFAYTDVGTDFGELPEGISQTPVQDDFNRELKRLRLERFKTLVSTTLELDLREDIRTKSEESAFLDLNRSTFLHRLHFLGIKFAVPGQKRGNSGTWKEEWLLQWSPEVEIQLVEAVLKGETIDIAAAYALRDKLDNCTDVFQATQLINVACVCKLTTVLDTALSTLQKLTAQASDFIKTANACYDLGQLLQYGDIRDFDTAPLVPLFSQLFLRGALLLVDYAGCDDKAAEDAASSIEALHRVSQENIELVDDSTWVDELLNLAARDDKNSKLSGLAFAILLERNLVDEDFCAREVSRRLSPGSPAELGAGWFEGMSLRNRYALLSRVNLWKELDGYIRSLDDEEFKRGLLYLRRAFSKFDPREKNSAAELLGGLYNQDTAQDTAIYILDALNDEEEAALSDLDDFDFGIKPVLEP